MILIVTNNKDISASKVIEWLEIKNAQYYRLNSPESDIVETLHLVEGKIKISFSKNVRSWLDPNTLSVIWFRRGKIGLDIKPNLNAFDGSIYLPLIQEHLRVEKSVVDTFVLKYFRARSINTPLLYDINKIEALEYAQSLSLNTPRSILFGRFFIEILSCFCSECGIRKD